MDEEGELVGLMILYDGTKARELDQPLERAAAIESGQSNYCIPTEPEVTEFYLDLYFCHEKKENQGNGEIRINFKGQVTIIYMEDRNPQEAAESGKAHAKAAAEDFKAAAGAKAAEIRHAAEQKAADLRSAAEEQATKFRSQAQDAWSDAQSKARSWQSDGEVYIRDNPGKSVLFALGAGFVLGLIFRK